MYDIKMSEKLPSCPICNQKVLLPFSSDHVTAGGKTFSFWFCSNCGFYLTTTAITNRSIDPEKDIKTGINLEIRQKIGGMKKNYQKTQLQEEE